MARPEKIATEALLDRAGDLFWRDGCDVVSTRDLEAALDLRAPALYRRFGSKHGMLAACVDRYVERVVAPRLSRVLGRTDDPLADLRAFFDAMLAPHPDEDLLRGCLLTHTATHREAGADGVTRALAKGFTLIEAALREELCRAAKLGTLRDDIDPASVTKTLFISLQGLLTLARAGVDDLGPGIDAAFRLLRTPAADRDAGSPKKGPTSCPTPSPQSPLG